MKKLLITLTSTVCVFAQAGNLSYIPQPYMLVGDSVLPNDKAYYKYENKEENFQLIFPKEHLQTAQHALSLDSKIVPDYAKLYGWHFDETLHVGLISTHSQIANGFSTQWPTNRQINYVGGVEMIDYFCSSSWLDTLLYHETAHNYQINIKNSAVSQTLHTIFGNGMTFGLWTMPNLAVNPFMLEGNAVLNESWHGNGGRLYSGRFQAETILQAQAGNVTPAKLYNQRLAFPYGDIRYIQGGFYNYFIAQKYGLKEANRFFQNNSDFWFWPFFTNIAMQHSIGVDFEDSVEAFSKHYKKLAQHFVSLHAQEITSSQFFYPLNKQNNQIFTLINTDGISIPKLLILDTQNSHISTQEGSWIGGKIFFVDGKYYSASTNYTSATRITQGLFDANGFLKKGSGSKVFQTVLSDGREVYFDTNTSFVQPQLYVDGKFYAHPNSSVISDTQDNLYYFVQKGKTRTLYKNKTPLLSYQGFYGIVCDVDQQGGIYFVASSQYGSTLYMYKNNMLKRVLASDDVIDAKVLPNHKLFVATIGSDAYHYSIANMLSLDEQPFEVTLFFENKPYYKKYSSLESKTSLHVNTQKLYKPLFEMHYNGSEVSFGSINGINYGSINAKFADPLGQNAVQLFYQRDDLGIGIVGAGYENAQYLLHYTLQLYKTVETQKPYKTNDIGMMASATLPLYKEGYAFSDITLSYFEDYLAYTRKPLSITLSGGVAKRYGVSMYNNYQSDAKIYGVFDAGTHIVGGKYNFFHDIADGWYIGANAQYSYSDATTYKEGVKLSSSFSFEDLYDPSMIYMPTLNGIAYIKQGGYGSASLYKVLDFSKYYFTFPFSLQREALYGKYKHYEIESLSSKMYGANEITLGARVDTVFFNNVVLPLHFEYIYNDADFIQDNESFRFYIEAAF